MRKRQLREGNTDALGGTLHFEDGEPPENPSPKRWSLFKISSAAVRANNEARRSQLNTDPFFRRTKQGQLTEEEKERKNKDLRKYKRYGPIARIARDPTFENVTLAIISLNAVWIGFDTNVNAGVYGGTCTVDRRGVASCSTGIWPAESIDQAHPLIQIGENLFCMYFTAEVIIRYWAFHTKRKCFTDAWLMFDTALVSMMVLETWILPMGGPQEGGVPTGPLRLLRLARLSRMARLMRKVPELLTLIKGMLKATRSVLSTLFLLVMLMYIFAIVIVVQVGQQPRYNADWGLISEAMFRLFILGTLTDDCTAGAGIPFWTDETLMAYFLVPFFLLFVFLANMTVLNMLIGVLCEVVTQTANEETEKAKIAEVEEKISDVYKEIDADGSGMISRGEFDMLKENETVKSALRELGIEPKHVFALGDSLFGVDDDEELETEEALLRVYELHQEEAGVDEMDIERRPSKEGSDMGEATPPLDLAGSGEPSPTERKSSDIPARKASEASDAGLERKGSDEGIPAGDRPATVDSSVGEGQPVSPSGQMLLPGAPAQGQSRPTSADALSPGAGPGSRQASKESVRSFQAGRRERRISKELEERAKFGIPADDLLAKLEEPQSPKKEGEGVSRELTFQEFIAMVVKQRPENQVSVMDLAELQKCVRKSLRRTDRLIEVLGKTMESLPSAQQHEDLVMTALRPLLRTVKALRSDAAAAEARRTAAEAKVAALKEKLVAKGVTPVH